MKKAGQLEEKGKTPLNKKLGRCKPGGNNDDKGSKNRGGEEGQNIKCEEAPKNVKKCEKKIEKGIKKGDNKVEKGSGKIIAEGKKKKGPNSNKMKKCTGTCLKGEYRQITLISFKSQIKKVRFNNSSKL